MLSAHLSCSKCQCWYLCHKRSVFIGKKVFRSHLISSRINFFQVMWRCGCNCVCGACHKKSCGCECHALDPLSDHELMNLLIHEGKKMVSDVHGKNRNALMKLMVTSRNPLPLELMRAGIARIQSKIKTASGKACIDASDSRFPLLMKVAAISGENERLNNDKASRISIRKPQSRKPQSQKLSQQQKRCKAAKRAEQRRLARCKP